MDKEIKIMLISPSYTLPENGLRIISSYLKQHGYNVEMIFLNLPNSRLSSPLCEETVNDIINRCESADLIGCSLMTPHFLVIKYLTIKIKEKLDIPVIWGGIHATVEPMECLEYADMVCIGEGEEVMLELVNKLAAGDDISNIQNIYLKKDNTIIKNDVRNLEKNLDKYPFQDYDISTHYILKKNRIVKMTKKLLEEAMPKNNELGKSNVEYFLITTRNCPHNCTYCSVNVFRKIYHEKGKFIRKRSVENIIKEIELITKKYDFVKQILITDDTFFFRSKKEVKEFCDYYMEKINLPFRCYVSPLTMGEEKLKCMIEAGLFRVSMGIQSFSEETLKNLYKRIFPKEIIYEKIQLLEKYKSQIPRSVFHFIIDNPFETKKAKKETIKFIASLPIEYGIILFPLVFYPGTELYLKAMKNKLIKNKINDIYLKFWNEENVKYFDYLTHITYLCQTLRRLAYQYRINLPIKKIINLLTKDGMIMIFDNKFFLFLISLLKKLFRNLKSILQ